jgi:hypothetical protein
MDHLLLAVLCLMELGSLVYIFHSVARHAVEEPGEFGGHGLGRRLGAMRSLWQFETRHLECPWSEVGQSVQYNPRWMQETSEAQSGYLSPLPDFASHSPFGGVSWFQPNPADRD